jgi:spore coat protein U-like protein
MSTPYYFRLLAIVVFLVNASSWAAVSCDVSSSGVAFGPYQSIRNVERDTNGTISITCTGTVGDSVNYAISLNANGGTLLSRTLASANSSLQYNLFTDISRSQIWGDGTSGTLVVSDNYSLQTSPTTRDYTVYGRIPGGQTGATFGDYLDNITVRLDY